MPEWITVRRTVVPSSPRTRAAISSTVSASASSPLISISASPLRMPARSAGERSITDTMTGVPDSCPRKTPIPTMLPLSESDSLAAWSGVRNVVWPGSPSA